jgi:hypothetical protein
MLRWERLAATKIIILYTSGTKEYSKLKSARTELFSFRFFTREDGSRTSTGVASLVVMKRYFSRPPD